jgi:hypothetical protein
MQIEELTTFLRKLSSLIDCYQRGEFGFPDKVLEWLEEAEKILSKLRLPDGSEMSALRGLILKTTDQQTASDSRSSIRRAKNVAAAEALERAEKVMRERILTAEERLKVFEDKLSEGMTAFMLQNVLPEMESSRQKWLIDIWSEIRKFKPTQPLAIYLASSLSQADRCYILDHVISKLSSLDIST